MSSSPCDDSGPMLILMLMLLLLLLILNVSIVQFDISLNNEHMTIFFSSLKQTAKVKWFYIFLLNTGRARNVDRLNAG